MSYADKPKKAESPIKWFFIGAFALSLGGTVLAATIGAAIVQIPIIGLVGLLFLPFPTLFVYTFVTFFFFAVWRAIWPNSARPGIGVAIGVAAALAIGFVVPTVLNRDFNRQLAQFEPSGEWKPVKLTPVDTMALVTVADKDAKLVCDSFCLALLLSGKAKAVQVLNAENFDAVQSRQMQGKAYQLIADSDTCLASMPDTFSARLRNPSDEVFNKRRQRDFLVGDFLDDKFESAILSCMRTTEVAGPPRADMTFAQFEDEDVLTGGHYYKPKPTLARRFTVWDNRNGAATVMDASDIYGAYYIRPLWIWPYAGNAGSGGYFAPSLARGHLERNGPDYLHGYWEWIAGEKRLADEALARLPNNQ